MTDLNSVCLVGRITRDLDENSFGYNNNGNARANVSIAVNRSRKNGDQWVDEASYFDVTIWGKTAENLKPYLKKGQQIAVQGYLKQDRWEKDGQKHSKVSIVAESVNLCGGKSSNSNTSNSASKSNYSNSKNSGSVQNEPAENQNLDSDNAGFDDDIPF